MKKKKAVSKGRQDVPVKPAVVVGQIPSEAEILEMAELASYVFERPEAAALRKTLEHTSFGHFGLLKLQKKPIITYLLHLILRCPQMIRRPPGFEWILDEFQHILLRRRTDTKVDSEFWQSVQLVKRALRPGRPRDRARDFFRYCFITDLMHPPSQLDGVVVKFDKTEAVERCSEAEDKLFGRAPDTRAIWRSYQRVVQFLQKLSGKLE